MFDNCRLSLINSLSEKQVCLIIPLRSNQIVVGDNSLVREDTGANSAKTRERRDRVNVSNRVRNMDKLVFGYGGLWLSVCRT